MAGGELFSDLNVSCPIMDPVPMSREFKRAIYRRGSCRLAVQYSLVVSVSLNTVEFGYDRRLTDCVVIGCLIAIYLNNFLGRRLSLMVTGMVSIVGVLIEVTSAAGGKPRFSQFVRNFWVRSG
jgi:hypothetical protein